MGIRKTLDRSQNYLYADFMDAYWSIDDIVFYNEGSEPMLRFTLHAYPSREAKYMKNSPTNDMTVGVGGTVYGMVAPILYEWAGMFPPADIFGESAPTSVNAQKDVLYGFVKQYSEFFADATDILEE